MMKSDKKITLMVVSRLGGPVRQYCLSRALLVWGIIGLSVVLTAAFAASGVSLTRWVRAGELSQLEQENRTLQGEIDRLEASLVEFRREMDYAREAEIALRHMANLDPLSDDVWQVGVGGPEPAGPDPLGDIRQPRRNRVSRLGGGVDQLLRQARLQGESYSEIEKSFDEQRERWDCTPSIAPVRCCRVTGRFGMRTDPFTGEQRMHAGVDFSLPEGEPVYASARGKVKYAGRRYSFGNLVEIDHGNGIVTRYAHNSEIKVKKGQKVERGDVIALAGRTGRATASHVHYEIQVNGRAVNPFQYILPSGIAVD